MKKCRAKMVYHKPTEEASFKQKAAKNIVQISYSVLSENKPVLETSPTFCKDCGASLSLYSQLLSKDEYYKLMDEEETKEQVSDAQKAKQEKFIKDLSSDEFGWICEFCESHNRLWKNVVRPQSEDELFLLKKAPETVKTQGDIEEKKTNETEDRVDLEDDTGLIFCIDVSGSMGEKHQVSAEDNKKTASRIDLIMTAVLKQIEEMKKTHPNRVVGLVSFEDYVRLYGDKDQPVIPTKKNDNYDELLNSSRDQASLLLNKPLRDSASTVTRAIKSLKPLSCTALGPGLLCSIGLLQGRRGSRIILCTDGLANVGLGSLGGKGEISEPAKEFYDRVADVAAECGLSISIITIEGNACRVDALGPMTDRTGGTIHRVNPTNMDLSEIAANKLIATNVLLKVLIHDGLAFENQDSFISNNNGSVLEKKVGPVTENNEVFLEYRFKKQQELKQSGVNLEGRKTIPIQSQIIYTDLKGNEFIRIITQEQELTKDHSEAAKGLQGDVLTKFFQKDRANLALQGKTSEAKAKNEYWAECMDDMFHEEAEMDKPREYLVDFLAEKKEMDALLDDFDHIAASNNVAKKDDIQSQFYKIKQTKKK